MSSFARLPMPRGMDVQLQFWKRDEPTVGYREEIIISNRTSMVFCPALSQFTEHSPQRHDNGQVRARTARLWPYTWVTAGVRVLNGRMSGELSNTVQFLTREDSESCTYVDELQFVSQLDCVHCCLL